MDNFDAENASAANIPHNAWARRVVDQGFLQKIAIDSWDKDVPLATIGLAVARTIMTRQADYNCQ